MVHIQRVVEQNLKRVMLRFDWACARVHWTGYEATTDPEDVPSCHRIWSVSVIVHDSCSG